MAAPHRAPDHDVVIVGAGFSGIGAAIQLDRAGMHDYLIVEAGEQPGGTWYWNTYPGIAVDIPSFSYQFSFEQSTEWTRTYAPGTELADYAAHCVEKYGLRPKIRFGTTVLGATFDDADNVWVLDNFNDFYDPEIKRSNIAKHANDAAFTLIEGDLRDPASLQRAFDGDERAQCQRVRH